MRVFSFGKCKLNRAISHFLSLVVQQYLKFITRKVDEAARESSSTTSTRLKFILGTEAGMVTSIVKSVQDILDAMGSNVEAEIVFPVASDAIMGVEVSGGEGCSTAGVCGTCPFMKMNDLDRL